MENLPSNRATLTGLPAELRLLIWSFTIDSSSCHIRRGRPEKPPTKSIWSVLHINQSTRNEILPLFFPTVTFHLREDLTETDIKTWADVIGEQAIREMKNVVVKSKRICAGTGRGRAGGTNTCTRTSFYNSNVRLVQLLDLAEFNASSPNCGYRPSMFYMFAHELCSLGASACAKRTMAELGSSGSEEWYLKGGEVLDSARLVGWWKAMSVDYLEVEQRET